MEEAVDLNASQQGSLRAVTIVMMVTATVSVVLRTWSVLTEQSRKLGLDDFFVTVSLPLYLGEASLILWWISLGLGRHEAALATEDLLPVKTIVFASGFLFITALVFPKFSVLFFYHRIFQKGNRTFSTMLRVAGGLNLAWLIATYFAVMFQCKPIRAAWTVVPNSQCIPIGQIYFGTSLASTLIDLGIILMPVPMLLNLKTSKTRRALVLMTFLCGYCVIITSIGRLISGAQIGADLTNDATWSCVTYIKWVQCEGALSIMSTCLPNILGFARRIHQHGMHAFIGKTSKSRSQPQYDFQKKGTQNSALPTHSDQCALSHSSKTTMPKDAYGSQEELRELSSPENASPQARSYMIRKQIDIEISRVLE